MFFRNAKPHQWTFEERLANLKQFGFESKLEGSSQARVTRRGYGSIVKSLGDGNVALGKPGVLGGDEIAELVNHGYQMFLRTPSGRELPALAPQLTALHAFDEDLREGLGITSLYNVSLGTTSDAHMYDRVQDRDKPVHPRPWEKKSALRP
jgi:hypothetical protein